MAKVLQHSSLVGGSTASRVMACPGSVALSKKVPPKPSSSYADEGTLLHDVMSDVMNTGNDPEEYLGRTYEGIELTQDLIDDKITPALEALDELDPEQMMEFAVEADVNFGDLIPDAFGSVDVVGKLDDTTIILDWKFGDGVQVDVLNNKQLLFYAAAARRTKETQWAFQGTKHLKLVIIQPPGPARVWNTTFELLDAFEKELVKAVKLAQKPDAALALGDHCRWCPAKTICPLMNGEVDRALNTQLTDLSGHDLGEMLDKAKLVEQWIGDLRGLAMQMLENDQPVNGYKLVQKRATRAWVDVKKAEGALRRKGLKAKELYKPREVISPAQAEKVLKKHGQDLPEKHIEKKSSGTTLAPESDPRPAVLQIGRQLSDALSKIQ